jgi:FkbM family methyltransferase
MSLPALSGLSQKLHVRELLRLPLRLIPPETVVPIMQGRLRGTKWIVGSSNHGCWLGNYEYSKRTLFERTVKENSVVFDAGAHVGLYTLLASQLVGPNGQVFAFEPLPANLRYLREHLRLNRIRNVTVLDAAVSDRSGSTFFDEGPNRFMGRMSSAGRLPVPTVSIDELVARRRLPPPDYIKMDIEGSEVLGLSGAVETLARYRPTVFLATHGAAVHHECCRLLASLGYELQPLDGTALDASSEILATASRQRANDVALEPVRSAGHIAG